MLNILKNKPIQANSRPEINLFDVKELYDAAYAEKAKARVNLVRFRILLETAEKMDLLYRQQLTEKACQPFQYRRAA